MSLGDIHNLHGKETLCGSVKANTNKLIKKTIYTARFQETSIYARIAPVFFLVK